MYRCIMHLRRPWRFFGAMRHGKRALSGQIPTPPAPLPSSWNAWCGRRHRRWIWMESTFLDSEEWLAHHHLRFWALRSGWFRKSRISPFFPKINFSFRFDDWQISCEWCITYTDKQTEIETKKKTIWSTQCLHVFHPLFHLLQLKKKIVNRGVRIGSRGEQGQDKISGRRKNRLQYDLRKTRQLQQ